jgi:predicted transposase/invertase (TIGR01784 family)
MKHPIDPKVDCVFKAILGSEENRDLLIHFLNAFLAEELAEPLVWVEILNPYNDKEFISDKLSVVDVKAKDSHERLYQIEIQLSSYGHLPARILYNWADIYSQQLKSGQDYGELKPTYSIWLLAENLIKDDLQTIHHYKMRDEMGKTFNSHGGIWLLELSKFHDSLIESEDQRWLKFFNEAEKLDDNALPDWMNTAQMRQAMNTLTIFSEKERQYFQYQARQEYLREQRTIQKEQQATQKELAQKAQELAQTTQELEQKELELTQTTQELEQKELALTQERQEKQAAFTEIERLKALLAQKR